MLYFRRVALAVASLHDMRTGKKQTPQVIFTNTDVYAHMHLTTVNLK